MLKGYMRLFAVLLVSSLAFAGEYAELSTGFMLRIDRHQYAGDKVLLYRNGGVSEMSAGEVVRFHPEETTPQPEAPAPAPSEPQLSPKALLDQAAYRYGLEPALVHAVARAESGYQATAVSPKGAIGIMQLMPETARLLGADPHDPAQNVDAGTRYLRDMLLKYDGGLYRALAAYNAGPGAVDRYGWVPPYPETISYVRKVEKQYKASK